MSGRRHDRTWRRTVRRWRWRTRHATAVGRWSAGLALAAALGHAVRPTWWPVPVVVAGCGVAALTICRWALVRAARRGWWTPDPDTRRVLRRRQRAHEAAGALAVAGALAGAVWGTGWTAATLAGWLVATGGIGAGWAFRQRVRRREAAARRRTREAAEKAARKAERVALSRAQRAFRDAVVTTARIEPGGLGIGDVLALATEHGLSADDGRAILAATVEDGTLIVRRESWAGRRWHSPWHDQNRAAPTAGAARRAQLRAVGEDE